MDLIETDKYSQYRHPWEISRGKSVISILKSNPRDIRYADIGAGDMYFTRKLTGYTDKPVYAVDSGYNTLNNERYIIQYNKLEDIPSSAIDYMVIMHVLEHIEDEDLFLERIKRYLNNNGEMTITVPACQFLFSDHDVFLNHRRRYYKKKLIRLLKKHGFRIRESFYFYTGLLLVRFLQLFMLKLKFPVHLRKAVARWKYSEKNIVTVLIKNLLDLDFCISRVLGRMNLDFPGLNLCVICQKKSV